VNRSFVEFFRRSLSASRGSLAVLVAIVMVLVTATGVALAQDPSTEQATQSQSSTSDPTTSTSDPTTSSTSDSSTSTSDSSTTTSDEDGEASDEGTTSEQTTTTSDTLNTIAVAPRDHLSSTTPPTTCVKIEDVDFGGLTTSTVVGQTTNTVTLTFTFNHKNNDPSDPDYSEATSATWSASAPFTGEIIVKSGSGEVTTTVTNATTGTIISPGGQGVSHVEICGHRGTTTTTTSTDTSTTDTSTTDTSTTDTSTTDTSTTDTSTTGTTTTGTGGTAGTTTAGTTPTQGVAGAVGGGGPSGKAGGGTTSPVAEEAVEAQGGLAFTGLHVPALILIALGTSAAGLVLRKRLEDAA
jgi:hypothetical protein